MPANRSAGTGARVVAQRRRTGISFEDMAARRAERLINLVICLLSTRQFLTAERIRAAIPGYEAADGTPETDEAFKRMFERDKAELRDLGIPLEVGHNGWEPDEGYRIRRGDYELPPIEFDAAESTAVGLAARLWQSATLGQPAMSALMKLRAAGTDVQTTGRPGAVPRVDASDPALPTLLAAARGAQVVRFDYQKPGDPEPLQRTVEPWGVLSWRGRWYVVGLDRQRGEARSFRLSRLVGPVSTTGRPGAFERPEGVDLLALVAGGATEAARVARIRVSATGAGALRRLAESDDGGVLQISFTDPGWLADRIAAAGSGAHVLEPRDLADAVVERLTAVAAVAAEPRLDEAAAP